MRVCLLVCLLAGLARPALAVERDEVGEVTDSVVDDILTGAWLDPKDPYWLPRRGNRFELSLLLGAEGALGSVAPDRLPTLGGVVVNPIVRYYPVDRLAVIVGARGYLGLDNGSFATGTKSLTVVTGVTGVRYDLVRENRFSLLWDLYSGPSVFVATDVVAAAGALTTGESVFSVGGEMGTGLTMRYSLGPFTGEVRGCMGGRAGASATPFSRSVDEGQSGPSSALYAGVDVGATWSM